MHWINSAVLSVLGDSLDEDLKRVLSPLGDGLAEMFQQFEEVKKTHGDSADFALFIEDEILLLEDFLGVSFVACQAYINRVTSQLASIFDPTGIGALPRDKWAMLEYGHTGPTNGFSRIRTLYEFANYYKHEDEWDADWTNAAAMTAKVISKAGASPHSGGNIRRGAAFLGNPDFSNVLALAHIFTRWRQPLVEAYRTALA